MKKLYAFSFYLLLFLTAVGQTKKLAVIGSSTSACFGFPSGISDPDCYINRLVTYYGGVGISIDLRNLAVSGTNVYNGMPDGYPPIAFGGSVDLDHNISEALTPTLTPTWHPDVVIVNFPTNQYQNLGLHDILLYFRIIKNAANIAGKPCFITTTQPRDDYDAPTRAKLKELRDSIMFQHGPFAIDFWTSLANPDGTIVTAYARGDGIHLNADGHNILFQRVQAANIFNSALPVRITSFATKTVDKNIQVKWTVADEIPGTVYRVQRSQDGVRFETVIEIRGNDRGASTYNYAYNDKAVVKGIYYYRLEVMEPGNKFYSKVEKGYAENRFALTSVSYSGGLIKLNVVAAERDHLQFRLLNSMGATVAVFSRSVGRGMNSISLDRGVFNAGLYWIQGFAGNEKMFVQGFVSQ